VIGVIDYEAGNAPSVGYALDRIGVEYRFVGSPDEVAAVDHLILPGVGAARATLRSLRQSDLLEILEERVMRERVPFLGICIGLQVLFDHSEEADTPCLGWVAGNVRLFANDRRVPQIGWNEVRFAQDDQAPHPFVDGLPRTGGYFYFVNSYYAVPAAPEVILGATEYGHSFCSVVASDNIVATQFHAEKSGQLGLRLLENFARWDGRPC